MLKIRPAAECGFDVLVRTINAGYADYFTPVHFTRATYDFFVRSHGIDLERSVVAEEDGVPVGIAQLAHRGAEGWVAGVAVVPSRRRQGIGRRLMAAIRENAVLARLQRLRLEVISQNTAAMALYENSGWRLGRELLVWYRPAEQGVLPIPRELLQAVDPAELLENCFHWHDQTPCWQRSRETLRHYLKIGCQGWAIVREGRPVAYLLGGRPVAGQLHLLDVAVDPSVGIRSAGRPLIQALHLKYQDTTTQLLNEPVESHLNPLFAAMAYRVKYRQYEMFLDL